MSPERDYIADCTVCAEPAIGTLGEDGPKVIVEFDGSVDGPGEAT